MKRFPHFFDVNDSDDIGDELTSLQTQLKSCAEGTVDPEDFWMRVKKFKNGLDEPMFPKLSKFAMKLLSLPHSTAAVERIFSSVNMVKTKARNRLTVNNLKGRLLSKQAVKKRGSCCSFVPPARLVRDCVANMPSKRHFELYSENELRVLEADEMCD